MATLGKDELLKSIENGILRIEPFRKEQVGPASINLHLGNSFRVFEKTRDVFHVREDADYKQLTRAVKVERNGSFLIMPNELVQGITEETLTLPSTLSGRIEGRSRFAARASDSFEQRVYSTRKHGQSSSGDSERVAVTLSAASGHGHLPSDYRGSARGDEISGRLRRADSPINLAQFWKVYSCDS